VKHRPHSAYSFSMSVRGVINSWGDKVTSSCCYCSLHEAQQGKEILHLAMRRYEATRQCHRKESTPFRGVQTSHDNSRNALPRSTARVLVAERVVAPPEVLRRVPILLSQMAIQFVSADLKALPAIGDSKLRQVAAGAEKRAKRRQPPAQPRQGD
jgi:hypothetical protein